MGRSIQSVKNSLKFKAQEQEGVLYVRVKGKKLAVPVTTRMLAGDHFIFLSVPSVAEVFAIGDQSLESLSPDADGEDALKELEPGRSSLTGRRRQPSVPAALEEALRMVPAGYRVSQNPDGTVKLVRMRRRRDGR